MDFTYPESHAEISKLALDIFTDYSEPERLKKLEEEGPYFDKEVWGKLIETSLHAASLPESIDGMGMDYNATTMIAEAIGRTAVMIPYIPCVVAAALPLSTYIDNEEVRAVLEKLVSGDGFFIAAHIEPGNENPLQPDSHVKTEGKDWIINGVKHCVPYAKDADAMLLSAMSDGELWVGLVNIRQQGVSLIEQRVTSNEPQFKVMMQNASATVIATGTEATALMEKSVAMTSMAYCSMAVGLASRMTKIAAEYTSERKQFGVPIATFQAVAHRLANCYIDTECLKIMTIKAADDVSQGNYHAETLHMAKVWCGDVLHRVSHGAQHVHGGMGIDRDYHLFRYCLWAKQVELALGNSKVHIARLADELEKQYLKTV